MKLPPVTVAIVVAAPFPALQGSQVLVRQLAEGLAQRGHRIHLVTYGADSGALPKEVVVHRIPRLWGCKITASGPHPGKVILDALLAMKLLAVVRRQGVDLIHAHNYEAAIASLLVARVAGRPVVYHGHSAMADELPTYFATPVARAIAARMGAWLDRHVPCRADYCIGVTSDLVQLLRARGVSADGVECIVPGTADLEEEEIASVPSRWIGLDAAPTESTLLYAGNLDRYQNLDFLLRSFGRVRAMRPRARLLVVTHGEGSRYRRRARELGNDGVRVLRVRSFPEARALIAAADIALCPRTEATGFPMKLLNYMAAAKPIVACAGSAKMLRDGQTGLVVPNDDVQAFADAVIRLLDNPAERRRLGSGARAAVRSLCASRVMLDRIEGIYQRVLTNGRSIARARAVPAGRRWAESRSDRAAAGGRS